MLLTVLNGLKLSVTGLPSGTCVVVCGRREWD